MRGVLNSLFIFLSTQAFKIIGDLTVFIIEFGVVFF
jgi:hypothetical protein